MLGIRDTYIATNKLSNLGVEGYNVEKKYFDPKNQSFGKKKSSKKLETKKGSYLDDYINLHKKVPGPGVYNYELVNSTFEKSKNSKQQKFSQKLTIFDEMCKRQKKQKKPAPGQYEPEVKKRPSSAVSKKPVIQDRGTFLDEVQYEASISPGVGSYNLRPQSAKVGRIDRMKPEDWRKKHSFKQKVTKQPDSTTYNPLSVQRKDFSKPLKGYTTWGNIDRFKNTDDKDKIGPCKYMGHKDWGTKVGTGSFKTASVYYC